MAKISDLSDGGSLLPTDDLVAVRSGANVKVKADNITVDRIDLGDNEKIRLGDSQDLEIYHSASDSIINDNGTGSLKLQQGGSTKLEVTTTGIDVTGTVTSDGLTVDGDVTINSTTLKLSGDFPKILLEDTAGSDADSYIVNNANGLFFGKTNTPSASNDIIKLDLSGGDISFFDTSGNAAVFFDASAASLGIGTTSPQTTLDVKGTFAISNSTTSYWDFDRDDSDGSLKIADTGTERMRIDSSGNLRVGVGNTFEPTIQFTNSGRVVGNPGYSFNGDLDTGMFNPSAQGTIAFANNGVESMRIDSSGNVGIGTTTPDRAIKIEKDNAYVWIADAAGGNVGFIGGSGSNDGLMRLYEGTGHTAKVEIHSNADSYFNGGNVGIGDTAPLSPLFVNGNEATVTTLSPVLWARSATGASIPQMNVQGDQWQFGGGGTLDTTPTMTIDYGSNTVGIGTTSPAYNLVVSNGGASGIEFGPAYSGTANLIQHYNRSGSAYVDAVNDAAQHRFNIGGSERLRIDSSGNVGIGRSNPSSYVTDANSLYVKGQIRVDGVTNSAATPALLLDDSNSGLFAGASNEVSISTTGSERLRIGSSGHAYLITGGAALQWQNGKQTITGASDSNDLTYRTYEDHIWKTGTSVSSTTDGTERMRIDASGRLLVGTTDTNVADNSAGSTADNGLVFNTGALSVSKFNDRAVYLNRTSGDGAIAEFRKNGSPVGSIGTTAGDIQIGSGDTALRFQASTDSVFPAQASGGGRGSAIDLGLSSVPFKDIYLSGDAFVNKTTKTATGTGIVLDGDGFAYFVRNGAVQLLLGNDDTGGTSQESIRFVRNTSDVGSIDTTNTATSYNTSSDYRLKENVIAMSGATERLKQLKPSRFNFIADPDKTVDGFLAHEVQDVVPEAITGTKDAVDAEGNPEYQGIDQSKLVPLLVATIQELEARIAALEGAN